MPKTLRSFRPVVDGRSRILILGTMPGPEALRKREYYGFTGNHFWKLLPAIFGRREPLASYKEKIAFVREHRIALWDTIARCTREGALDSAIRQSVPNDIIGLIQKYPGIHTIFLNGKTSEKLYNAHFRKRLHIAAYTLPSTSPAHASMSLAAKLERWGVINDFLKNRNPWC